ncbi:MAG: hypothetical protein L6R42_004432 [Xanthoria sp. 1 TBL-2021]|nr:MAG: hypothetical protein L6R42_004432 [Xanthoria sp. 1 TBL-2021]
MGLASGLSYSLNVNHPLVWSAISKKFTLRWRDSDEAKRRCDKYCTELIGPPSSAIQEFVKQCIPHVFRPEGPQPELTQTKAASAAGDLDTGRILINWEGNPEGGGYRSFGTWLDPALESGNDTVAETSCLLQYEAMTEPIDFTYAIQYIVFPVLDLYFRHGYDINHSGCSFDPTALAAAQGDEETTRWLLKRGAEPNVKRTVNSAIMDETPLSISM